LPPVRRWWEIEGQTIQWDTPADERSGIPNGGFYLFEHNDILQATLRFLDRKGRRFRIHWKGSCNVFWDKNKYGEDVPFDLNTVATFTGISVGGSWKDNDETMRKRLSQYLDPADFVQQPIQRSECKHDYGVWMGADTIFKPKPKLGK
jgi:hypothetical protein